MQKQANVIDMPSLGNAARQSVPFLAAAQTAFAIASDHGKVRPTAWRRRERGGDYHARLVPLCLFHQCGCKVMQVISGV